MNKDKRTIIAYIGGGSVNFGWRFFSELASEEIYATVNLYDISKDRSLANEVIANNLREVKGCKSDIVYIACDTPKEALRNADIVVMSFSQGSIEEMSDIHTIPEAYGIYQSTGECAGPASIINALITLPEYMKYAKLIKELCPDAWVINMTNPMSECMQIMYKIFPQIKLFGSSNEIYPALELLGGIVEREKGIRGIRRRDIKFNLLGISGFNWFDSVSYDGEDIMPLFRSYAERFCEDGFELRSGEYKANPYSSANKIKFDLFLRYGLICAVSDRIAADFCPAWYLKSPAVVSGWKFSRTSVNYIKKLSLDRESRVKSLVHGTEHLPVSAGASECVLQIRALLGGGNLITNISSRNCGQISNLPDDAIVSTNALISKNSVKPVTAGSLPDELYALTIRHVINQKTVVKAVEEKDLDIAFNAFLNDPLVSCDLNSATELYKEMLAAVRKHLIYFC